MNTKGFLSVVVAAALLALVVPGSSYAAGTNNTASVGAVFTMTNSASGNSILAYDRSVNGSLSLAGSYSTDGLGTGASLGSQGSIALTPDHQWLLAVNAGSNEITVFRVNENPSLSLTLTDKVSSNGIKPISIATNGNLVYVLNTGTTSAGNIAGYYLNNGMLSPISGSIQSLSGVASAAQISFNPAGTLLIVTEKTTNIIDTYTVNSLGVASAPISNASHGTTPFGFALDNKGHIIVSEAATGALSSYSTSSNGTLATISGSVTDGYLAACWVVIPSNGKVAFTTNAHSNTISSYRITSDGTLGLLQALSTNTDAAPTEMALSQNSKYLFVLDSGASEIQTFSVNSDGTLDLVQTISTVGTVGLAAN